MRLQRQASHMSLLYAGIGGAYRMRLAYISKCASYVLRLNLVRKQFIFLKKINFFFRIPYFSEFPIFWIFRITLVSGQSQTSRSVTHPSTTPPPARLTSMFLRV